MSSRKGRKGRRRKMQGRVVGEPLLGAPRGVLTGREALLPAPKHPPGMMALLLAGMAHSSRLLRAREATGKVFLTPP